MSGVSRASNAVADARFAQAASLSARPTGSYTTPWGESPLLRQLNISAAQDRAAAVAVCDIAIRLGVRLAAGDVLRALGLRADPEAAWEPGHPRAGKRRRVKNAAGEPG